MPIKGRRLSYAKTPNWMKDARDKRLKKWFLDNEVLELRRLPLYLVDKYGIIKGRRNQARDYMKAYGMTKKQAIEAAYEVYRRSGYKVLVGDYIDAYAQY